MATRPAKARAPPPTIAAPISPSGKKSFMDLKVFPAGLGNPGTGRTDKKLSRIDPDSKLTFFAFFELLGAASWRKFFSRPGPARNFPTKSSVTTDVTTYHESSPIWYPLSIFLLGRYLPPLPAAHRYIPKRYHSVSVEHEQQPSSTRSVVCWFCHRRHGEALEKKQTFFLHSACYMVIENLVFLVIWFSYQPKHFDSHCVGEKLVFLFLSIWSQLWYDYAKIIISYSS